MQNQKDKALKILVGSLAVIILLGIAVLAIPAKKPAVAPPDASATPASDRIVLKIEGEGVDKSFSRAYPEKVTVARIIEDLEKEGSIAVRKKDFGGNLGIFVEALAGVENDAAGNKYWQLYLNGKLSPTGASATEAGAGDMIVWRFEAYSDLIQ